MPIRRDSGLSNTIFLYSTYPYDKDSDSEEFILDKKRILQAILLDQ